MTHDSDKEKMEETSIRMDRQAIDVMCTLIVFWLNPIYDELQ